jgi:hypothetical protein
MLTKMVIDLLFKMEVVIAETTFVQNGNKIRRMSIAGPTKTAVDIEAKFEQENGIRLSRRSVSNCLQSYELRSSVMAKKPTVIRKNQKAKHQFALTQKQPIGKRPVKILFFDEFKFSLFDSHGKRYLRPSVVRSLTYIT